MPEPQVLTLSQRINYWRKHFSTAEECRSAEEMMLKLAKCSPEELAAHLRAFDSHWKALEG
jgi:hypothetical protein